MGIPEVSLKTLTRKDLRALRIRYSIHRAFPNGEGSDVRCFECEAYIARAVTVDEIKAKIKEHEAFHETLPPPPVQQPTVTRRAPKHVVEVTRVFTVANPAFVPGKGLATEIFKVIGVTPLTAQEITDQLLSSGAYFNVAPKAAARNPLKPVEVFLSQFEKAGAIK